MRYAQLSDGSAKSQQMGRGREQGWESCSIGRTVETCATRCNNDNAGLQIIRAHAACIAFHLWHQCAKMLLLQCSRGQVWGGPRAQP